MRPIMKWILLCLGLSSCLAAVPGAAQAPPLAPTEDAAVPKAGSTDLLQRQSSLARDFKLLEDLMFKRADFESATNPRRAALLMQAVKLSKDKRTLRQLQEIVDHLSRQPVPDFGSAASAQETVAAQLKELLSLLQSEDREDRLQNEQERIKQYLQELKRLERLQRANRGRTESGADAKQLAKNQQDIANRTGELSEQLQQDEVFQPQPAGGGAPDSSRPPDQEQPSADKPSESPRAPNESQQPQGNRGEQPPKADQPPPGSQPSEADQQAEAEQPDGSPKAGADEPPSEAKRSDQQPGAAGKSPQQPPQSGQPSPAQSPSPNGQAPADQPPGDPPQPAPSQQPHPTRERVKQAEEKMRQAQAELEQAQREKSVEAQRAAEDKLREAIADLEQILRQMREEEIERVLALLETRFRRMLEMQLRVRDGTVRLTRTGNTAADRDVQIQAGRLGFDQRKIAYEAEKTLLLLRDEGSSVAFPETVEQLRDDMERVAEWLGMARLDQLTVALEEDIIETLQELIAALQQQQRDREDQKKQEEQMPPGEMGEAPLVDSLAELKMIRSLQFRVNQRTNRYAQLLGDHDDPVGQASDAEMQQVLRELAQREQSIQQITRDIVLGKNK